MTRTNRRNADSGTSSKKGDTPAARQSQISHALSRLLRHQAENEKIPITPAGWVQLDHLLAWKGLSRIGGGVTMSEIFDAVEEDGRTGKGRFAVMIVKDQEDDKVKGSTNMDSSTIPAVLENQTNLVNPDSSSQPASTPPTTADLTTTPPNPASKNTPETQAALQYRQEHPSLPPSTYLIRATQGHSITTIQSADLLTPITLSDPTTIPTTVVHGTFYGTWPLILSSGGLKSMGRNNIHFATGPSLNEVLAVIGGANPADTNTSTGGGAMKTKPQVDAVLSKNKVISGMRWDAQLLIYVDLRRCLEDVKERRLDMTWWRSGNGVILTEGVVVPDNGEGSASTSAPKRAEQQQQPAPAPEDQSGSQTQFEPVAIIASKHAKAQRAQELSSQPAESPTNQPDPAPVATVASKHAKAQRAQELSSQSTESTTSQPVPLPEPVPIIASKHAKAQYAAQQTSTLALMTPNPRGPRLVPMEYVSAVVEIKNGVGVLWRHGEGVVKELPEKLKNVAVPRGKARGHGNESRGRGRGRARLNVERDWRGDRDGHGDGEDR